VHSCASYIQADIRGINWILNQNSDVGKAGVEAKSLQETW